MGRTTRLEVGRGRLASALAVLLLTGCAVTAPEPGTTAPAADPQAPEAAAARGPAEPAPAPMPDPVYGNFEPGTLYELLVAELSLRRGDFAPAVDRYALEARRTRDPGIVAKAARLASVTGEADRALELGLLWAQVAPRDPAAREAAAIALLEVGMFDAALEQLEVLRDLDGGRDFARLAARLDEIDPAARDDVIRALEALQARRPEDDPLRRARAALLERAGRAPEALTVLDAASARRLGVDALLLRARLLEGTGDPGAAAALLEAALAEGEDEARLRYRLARLLIDSGELEGAREQFLRLLERVGDNPEILLSLALVALEQERLTESRDWLERLLRSDRRPDTANYFLGVVAERAGDVSAALEAWGRVKPGFEFARAQSAAADLILRTANAGTLRSHLGSLRARHPDEGLTLWLLEGQALLEADRPAAAVEALTEALRIHPDRQELLYARAMAHDANGFLAGLEADLARMIALDPEDAMALNALGYTLADRTDRLEEARRLVERAVALDPDEPAYVDSLGWVEFRSGNPARAVELLEAAFADFPNHEVAAHLGEALWATGDRERARDVWRTGLGLEQPTEVLRDTLRRLLSPAERSALEADA